MGTKKVYALVTNDLNYDQRMQRICSSLQNASYDVTLVGRELPASEELGSRSYAQYRLRCVFNSGVLFYLEINLRLMLFLLSQKTDIIHAVDLDTLGAGTVIKMLKHCTLIFDAHEYFTEVPELEGKRVKKAIWSNLGKLCAPQVDAAITVSEPLQLRLSDKYNLDFQLVRNFPVKAPMEITDERINQRNKIILYQGAVNEGRGIEEAIALMKEITDYNLWIIGEGDILNKCKNLAKELGLEERIIFYGYLAPEDLISITTKAKIGLNLLEGSSENYQYSLANKFFDYIQALVPSITMKFDTYNSILEEHQVGVAIRELKTDELLSAVQRIESSYKMYIRNCRRAAEEYVWEREEEELLGLYDRIDK